MDKNSAEDDLPVWMKTIDEDTFYNTTSTDASDETPSGDPSPLPENESSPAPTPASAPNDDSLGSGSSDSGQPSDETVHEEARMSLRQKLSVSLTDPTGLPAPDPTLQPEALGPVRADLNEQVDRAVSLLDTRYSSTLSKSLFLDVALRQILIELHKNGEQSRVVSRLDSILDVD